MHEGIKSKVLAPNDMNYLDVMLDPGETWAYSPPKAHNVLWLVVYQGELSGENVASVGELIVFEEGNQPVEFTSERGTSFLLGSAKKFEHDLVLGLGAVHTSTSNLEASQNRIKQIYSDLVKEGVFDSIL